MEVDTGEGSYITAYHLHKTVLTAQFSARYQGEKAVDEDLLRNL